VRLTLPCHGPSRPCCVPAATKYDVLGVTRTASDKDIKRAFRKLALKLHPDVNKEPGAAKAFTAAKEAYETLSDVRRRKEYDISLESGRVGGPGAL
jgi:molecular chaperone DnaJ